jgi:hypothetical protein
MKPCLIAPIFAVLAGSAQAQSATEKYDLTERCARRAAEVFEKEWSTGKLKFGSREITAKYENHYNFRLNKCLYFITADTYAPGEGTDRWMNITDINEEGKGYAAYVELGSSIHVCLVQGKRCKDEQEWRELIRPLMEE